MSLIDSKQKEGTKCEPCAPRVSYIGDHTTRQLCRFIVFDWEIKIKLTYLIDFFFNVIDCKKGCTKKMQSVPIDLERPLHFGTEEESDQAKE